MPLPPPVDLAAYRIVQEALTNVTRHSGARKVRVTLDWGTDVVRLRIVDDGGGAPEGRPPGSGIRGMAERARAFGGELTAENGETGGFRVDARLPLPEPPTSTPATPTPSERTPPEPAPSERDPR